MERTTPGAADLRGERLPPDAYARNFADAHPPLTRAQALVEAERCLYCFDAPCTTACPTAIDVPTFIQRIAQDNLRGAARAILEANPLGGMCARVCPTELLCEQVCVRHQADARPVEIGALQRYATDAYLAAPGAPLFTRAAPSGKRVAVVGAGPAGLACAHGLARRGHEVVLFDAKPKLGGLNEYGLAAYKTAGDYINAELLGTPRTRMIGNEIQDLFSAGAYPRPFWVSTWTTTGPPMAAAFLSAPSTPAMSWPSKGPR